jgi:hypothetical protein
MSIKPYGKVIGGVVIVLLILIMIAHNKGKSDARGTNSGHETSSQFISITKEVSTAINVPLGYKVPFGIIERDVSYIVHYNQGRDDAWNVPVPAINKRRPNWVGEQYLSQVKTIAFSIDPSSEKESARIEYTIIPK